MAFSVQHAKQLDEINGLTRDLDRNARECLEQLEQIETAQDRALGQERYPPLIAFVHIPKTAGGTVTTMFAAAYSRGGIYNTGNYIRSPEKTQARVTKPPSGWRRLQRRGVRVAIGHTPYGSFHGNLPPGARYITFLREPIDRVLSHYYRHVHVPVTGEGEHRGSQGRRASSLEEALMEMRLPQLRNLSTRLLCSRPTLDELPPSALDEAKENLRTFAFVGVQERFEESIVLLQRTLGLGVVPYLQQHVSSAGHRPSVDEIPERDRAMIEECNQLDAELYRFGLELFEKALPSTDDRFARDVDRLRAAARGAAEEHRATVDAAREWLHRELPPGTTEPVRSLVARAEAAGLTRAALTEARKQLVVTGEIDKEGRRHYRRARADSLTALEEAATWLDSELPEGASELRTAVIERGEAAGHSREAVNRARKRLSVNTLTGTEGRAVWSRPAPSR